MRGSTRSDSPSWAVICLFLGIAVYGAIDTDGFLTADNFRAILSQSAYVGVFALATAIIMISGSLFSLSIGISGGSAPRRPSRFCPKAPWSRSAPRSRSQS